MKRVRRLEVAGLANNDEQTYRGVVFLDGVPVRCMSADANGGWIERAVKTDTENEGCARTPC